MFRATNAVLLAGAACVLSSCATKQPPALVSSGNGPESSIPWNQQEKWEQEGNFGPLAEKVNRR